MQRWIAPLMVGIAIVTTFTPKLSARDDSLRTKLFGSTPNVAVRGINAAGAPWVADNSRVRLAPNGDLEVQIRGLVIGPGLTAAGLPVNPAIVGTNPVANVTIAVTWAVPQSVAFPLGIAVQQTGLLPLSQPDGNLSVRTNIGAAPAGAERPIVLVRANGGAYIGISDFPGDLGSSNPRDDD